MGFLWNFFDNSYYIKAGNGCLQTADVSYQEYVAMIAFTVLITLLVRTAVTHFRDKDLGINSYYNSPTW